MTLFIKFVKNITHNTERPHTAHLSSSCGLSHVKYDVYIDVENEIEGFHDLINKRPDLDKYIYHGWKQCALTGGSDSILNHHREDIVKMNASSSSKEVDLEKRTQLDKLFCNESVSSLVYNHFYEDYKLLSKFTNFPFADKSHVCLK